MLYTQNMNKNLKSFLQGYLNVEVAHYDMNEVVATLRTMTPEFQQDLKEAFADLLAKKYLTVNDYFELTLYAFDSEGLMYDYLSKVYAFLYEGLEHQPYLPN